MALTDELARCDRECLRIATEPADYPAYLRVLAFSDWDSERKRIMAEVGLLEVIGLCGAAGAGKDEAARVLCAEYGFVKHSFAEALRREVADALASGVCPADAPMAVRVAFSQCLDAGKTDPWRKPTPLFMRRLLQLYGTEYRRAQDPDYWTKAARKALPKHGRVVFTDVRFPNELALIRSLGGFMARIDRPGMAVTSHASEQHYPGFAVDAVITNDGSVERLADQVRGLVVTEGKL